MYIYIVDFDYCSTRTIQITIEDKLNHTTQEIAVIENGKIEDLLSELQIRPMEYDIRVNDQRDISIKDSFVSTNIRTNDRLVCILFYVECFMI